MPRRLKSLSLWLAEQSFLIGILNHPLSIRVFYPEDTGAAECSAVCLQFIKHLFIIFITSHLYKYQHASQTVLYDCAYTTEMRKSPG